MAARLVLNRVVHGREVVRHALGWGPTVGWSLLSHVLGLCMSMCSGGQSLLTVPVLCQLFVSSSSIKSSSSLSSSLSGVIVSVISSTIPSLTM